jgi:hypothetical protein
MARRALIIGNWAYDPPADLDNPDIDVEVRVLYENKTLVSETEAKDVAWCLQQPVAGATALFRIQCFPDNRSCTRARARFVQNINIPGSCGFVPSLDEARLSRLERDADGNSSIQENPTPFRWPIPPLPASPPS